MKIIAVACSPRKGKTTKAALEVCLEAAREAGDQGVADDDVGLETARNLGRRVAEVCLQLDGA